MQLDRRIAAHLATLAVAAACTLGVSAAPALAAGPSATELGTSAGAAVPPAAVRGLKPFDGTLSPADFNY
jgi:hypothetical protein